MATIKDWHRNIFLKNRELDSKDWILIDNPEELNHKKLSEINPRYIFFPHWSWIVPDEIIDNFECVCFHSSDVPYGRGGSPIQNLIIRGFIETKISALRMVKELDAGPVYLKKDLSLVGNAQGIYEQMAMIISNMMKEIAEKEITPQPQTGDPVLFKRRTGVDNVLPNEGDLSYLYNHIRMLDADSYPSSFLNHGEFKIEFSGASLQDDVLEAVVRIKKKI